jgi:hypothetical protein
VVARREGPEVEGRSGHSLTWCPLLAQYMQRPLSILYWRSEFVILPSLSFFDKSEVLGLVDGGVDEGRACLGSFLWNGAKCSFGAGFFCFFAGLSEGCFDGLAAVRSRSHSKCLASNSNISARRASYVPGFPMRIISSLRRVGSPE